MKFALYVIAAVFLGVCIYIVMNLGSITVEKAPTQAEEPIEEKVETLVTESCEPKSFWEKYDIWGDTSTVYKPSSESDAASKTADINENCPRPSEPLN